MDTLKPHSNGPLYSNTVIGTLAVDGWGVTFWYSEEGTRRAATTEECKTSSSAVAKRQRDASCLSVVSFNSTYLERSILLLVTSASDLPVRTIRFCSVVFGITSSLAVIHTIHGRPWLCIARDRAWSVSHCSQSQMTVTAYSAWRLVVRYPQSTKTRPLSAIN